MTSHPIGRATAVLVTAALLASLAAVALASPVTAKPSCGGKKATIVGTARGEVIKGTPKADVIVARGGHDIILGRGGHDIICGNGGNDRLVGAGGNDRLYGKTGHDRLFGGIGRDWLVGGPGDDDFNGGPGDDACLQGSGTGTRVACERPPVSVPVPAPPPAPKVLARAYSDLDGSGAFTAGDVLISQLVDTNLDGVPSSGDTIVMGSWPTSFRPGPSDFRDWAVDSHSVANIWIGPGELNVSTATGGLMIWARSSAAEMYLEAQGYSKDHLTRFVDLLATGDNDFWEMDALSPSRPVDPVLGWFYAGEGDDGFINVDLLYGGSIL